MSKFKSLKISESNEKNKYIVDLEEMKKLDIFEKSALLTRLFIEYNETFPPNQQVGFGNWPALIVKIKKRQERCEKLREEIKSLEERIRR